MKALLFVLIVGGLLLAPFVMLKQPWAIRIWTQVKKLFWVYVLAITLSAAFWLYTRWDDFYG
ncbi:MAG: hypothetical protein AB7P33_18685 [Dehalococcoidia bacterium]